MENHIGRLILNRFQQHPEKVMLKIWENSAWRNFTGKEAAEITEKTALALLNEGVQDQEKIGIFSRNMPEWTITDVASSLVNAVPVPVFATQIAHEVKYILKDAGIEILFVGEKEQYAEIMKIIDDPDVNLKKVIVFDESVELKHSDSVHLRMDRKGQQSPSGKTGLFVKGKSRRQSGNDHLHLWHHRRTQRRNA